MKDTLPSLPDVELDTDFYSHLPRKLQEQFFRIGFLDPVFLFYDLISILQENDNGNIDGSEEANNPEIIISNFWDMCESKDLYKNKNLPRREDFKLGKQAAYELLFIAVFYFFRAENIFMKSGKCDEFFSYIAMAHYWLGRGEERLNFLDNFRMELPVREMEEDYKKQERSRAGRKSQEKTVKLKSIVKYLYMTNDSRIGADGFWNNNWISLDEAVNNIKKLLEDNQEKLKNKLNIKIADYEDILQNIEDWIREVPLYPIYIDKKRKPE